MALNPPTPQCRYFTVYTIDIGSIGLFYFVLSSHEQYGLCNLNLSMLNKSAQVSVQIKNMPKKWKSQTKSLCVQRCLKRHNEVLTAKDYTLSPPRLNQIFFFT